MTTAAELFGASAENNQLGVGADDSRGGRRRPGGEAGGRAHARRTTRRTTRRPSTQPTVVEEDGKPTGLDFSGIDEPALDTPVQRVVLEEGTGAAVKASDTVKVNYLGATYDAEQPLRRELLRHAPDLATERPDPGLEHRPHGGEGRQPRPAPDPTRLRVRRPGQRGDPRQRDPVVRDRRGGDRAGLTRSRAGQSPHARAVRRWLGGGAWPRCPRRR